MNYRPIATTDGKFSPWVSKLAKRSGVYVIRSNGFFFKTVLYVGESHTGSLAKTLKRHFYPWPDSDERRHHVYDRDAVSVAVRVTPAGSAVSAQNKLIRRLKPTDNGNGYGPEPAASDQPF